MANPSYRELLAKVDALIRLVDGFQSRGGELLISDEEQVRFLTAEHEVCQAAQTSGLLEMLLLTADRSRRRGLGRTKVSVANMGYPGVGLPVPSWRQGMVTFRETVARLAESEASPATGQSNEAKQKRQRRKPGDLNGAMVNIIMQRSESRGWSARRWSRELRAQPSQITDQPIWKELEQCRNLQKIERQKAKRQGRAAK